MKNLGNIVAAAVLVVGVVGLGFWLVPQWFPEGTLDGEPDAAVLGGPLVLEERTQTRHADVEGTDGCDVRLLYPQIVDDGSLRIASEARDKMNNAITAQVKDFLSTNTVSLDEAATAFATSCQADLAEAMSWMLNGAEAPDQYDDPYLSLTNGWESEIGYDVKLNDGKYLSLGFANYLSTGGAHPNTTELFLTFDVVSGDTLSLRDFLATEDMIAFAVQEKQWLVDTMTDQLFEESMREFAAFVAAPTQERAEAYVDDAIFYLTATDYVTFYNPYTIAPYVAGNIEVMIARES